MLTRSASFLIDLAKDRPVIWEKLDEAEPRYYLPRKKTHPLEKPPQLPPTLTPPPHLLGLHQNHVPPLSPRRLHHRRAKATLH